MQLLIVACGNVANELISIGLLNESWYSSAAKVLVSNEFDDHSEHIMESENGDLKRCALTCTTSSCDRFCSSCLRLASSDPYPAARRKHTDDTRVCCGGGARQCLAVDLKQRYSNVYRPEQRLR